MIRATSSKVSAAGLIVILLAASISGGSSAEIPHENYDLVGSDLEMVVSLLNASIRASEEALAGMLAEELESSRESLALIGTTLAPASALVDDMMGVADSYEDLSVLLPPFTELHDLMTDFLDMQGDLLVVRSEILALMDLGDMTDEQTLDALAAIGEIRSLIAVMNGTVESMLLSAGRIDLLTVDDVSVFVPNALAELIQDLGEYLASLELRIDDAIEGEIPWDEDISFLLLWLARDSVFLGEDLAGGGYLYSDSVFVEGVSVSVLIDGEPAIDLTTGHGGRFSFSFPIPVEEGWLGSHTISGSAALPAGALASDTLTFTVTLVPTVTTIDVPVTVLSPTDSAVATVRVMDARGDGLVGAACILTVDGSDIDLVTGEDGSAGWSRTASSLGFGPHLLSARYEGVLPYASSVSGTVEISVTIPTSINLTLVSDRLEKGDYLLGTCELFSNGTSPMAGRTVAISVDGVPVGNRTTDAGGSCTFSFRTDGLASGSHLASVSYEAENQQWRDAYDQEIFTITSYEKTKYPFFPWIPDWGRGSLWEIPELFFGENAYYAWLLVLCVLGLAVKAMSVRRRKKEARPEEEARRREYEDMRAQEGLPVWTGKTRARPAGGHAEEPAMPHDSVIWHYGRLMDFLIRRRRVRLADSMTHWEIARLLLSVGYPRRPINNVTTLFERAFYSGSGVSAEDAAEMRSSVREVIDHAGGAGRAD